MSDQRKDVPASACQFAGGEVAFTEKQGDGKATPIRMLARSAEPIEHPWWGRVVHDMSGVTHKKRIPVDYEHWEPIGYLDKFEASDEGLWVEGALVETGLPNDRVASLLALSRGGVPYESSIYFGGDGIKTEWLGEDQVAEVNGYTFEGPGVIIREWPLRGVAVCPYGADMHTESKFSRSTEETFSLQNLKETDMANKANTKLSDAPVSDAAPAAETKPDEKPVEQQPAAEQKPAETPAEATPATEPAPAAALSADRAECKRFVDSFGAVGGEWFAEGLTFEAAQARFTKQLRERDAEQQKQIGELTKKLAAAGGAGELTPVGFDAADKKKDRAGFASKIRIAAGTVTAK